MITGGGTGSEAITITLPNGTGMSMEVSLGCGAATVTIVDEYSVPVVSFSDVSVIGGSAHCGNESFGGFGAEFRNNPGLDFRARH